MRQSSVCPSGAGFEYSLYRLLQATYRNHLKLAYRLSRCVCRRHYDPAETLFRGFAQSFFTKRYRADFSSQPKLTKRGHIAANRSITQTGQRGKDHRQVRRGLEHTHTADHADEHILIVYLDPGMAMQDRQQQGQSSLVQTHGNPVRRRSDDASVAIRPIFNASTRANAGYNSQASGLKRESETTNDVEIR